MKVVFEQDSYVASTWGHAEHFKAGEPKEVGKDFGVLCLQNGAKEYEEPKVVCKCGPGDMCPVCEEEKMEKTY